MKSIAVALKNTFDKNNCVMFTYRVENYRLIDLENCDFEIVIQVTCILATGNDAQIIYELC